MNALNHLVVALSRLDSDRSLIAYAALLARLAGTREVRFVHVAEPSADSATLRAAMRAEVAEAFGGAAPRTECDVIHGPRTDRLLAYVTEAQTDLVVVGRATQKLGARLAMVAPCSVAIVPADREIAIRHVMVAIDFSPAAAATLRRTVELVGADDRIRCTALHVMNAESVEVFADGNQPTDAEPGQVMAAILEEAVPAASRIESRVVPLQRSTDVGRSHLLSFAAAIEGSDVAHTILSEAAAASVDCLVVSTRGRSRSASILLGSVAEKVIERATVPVLALKSGGGNLGLASILLGRAGRPADIKTN